jgi:hypothetical protein
MEDAWEETSSKSTNPIEIKVQTLDATDQKKTTPAVAQFQETTEATATVPSNWTGESIDSEPKIVTVMLDSSGDRNRDALRMHHHTVTCLNFQVHRQATVLNCMHN